MIKRTLDRTLDVLIPSVSVQRDYAGVEALVDLPLVPVHQLLLGPVIQDPGNLFGSTIPAFATAWIRYKDVYEKPDPNSLANE